MTMNDIADAFRFFLGSCPRDFEYPMGGDVAIPTESESNLILALQESPAERGDAFSQLREQLTLRECYACVIFSARMAIHAARTGNANYLNTGLDGLILDSGKVDYRDVLGVLSIVEDCAHRLGSDFPSKLKTLCDLIDDDRVTATMEGYLSRPPETRAIEVMGFVAVDCEEGLCYQSRR